MSTIKDVARAANVSVGTVSRYFHEPDRVREKTRDRIERAIAEVGYAPNLLARNFRMGSTGVIRILISHIDAPFYAAVVRGIHETATTVGYSIQLEQQSHETQSESHLRSIIRTRQADGWLVMGSLEPIRSDSPAASSTSDLPLVVCGETPDPKLKPFPRFQIDGFAAACEVTQHLISIGHRKIGMIGGNTIAMKLPEREAGFRKTMQEAGLSPVDSNEHGQGLSLEDGYHAMEQMLDGGSTPTAVVCASDTTAFGAMAALRSRGFVVPDDMSIVGFDASPYALFWNPPLTTIAQPSFEIGRQALLHLVSQLRGEVDQDQSVQYLPHELILRNSTSTPRT